MNPLPDSVLQDNSIASRRAMKPGPEALAWAVSQRVSALASSETIIDAYAAHLRILAKLKARKAST